jgi:hypothetical protein
MPSYWITHPIEQCFISALSPEGVGQLLLIAERWPAGRYVIREHRHAESPAGHQDRRWGHAEKDGDGSVRIETYGVVFGAADGGTARPRPRRRGRDG